MKPLTWPSAASFAQMTTMSLKVALPIQRFEPLMTHSSPSRVATVRRPCAESDPESGSVRPNAPISSPDGELRQPLGALLGRAGDADRAHREAVLHADVGGDRRVDPGQLERDPAAVERPSSRTPSVSSHCMPNTGCAWNAGRISCGNSARSQ